MEGQGFGDWQLPDPEPFREISRRLAYGNPRSIPNEQIYDPPDLELVWEMFTPGQQPALFSNLLPPLCAVSRQMGPPDLPKHQTAADGTILWHRQPSAERTKNKKKKSFNRCEYRSDLA